MRAGTYLCRGVPANRSRCCNEVRSFGATQLGLPQSQLGASRDTAYAGDVDLYVDRSENFVLTPEVLAGTDAILSLLQPGNNGQCQRFTVVVSQLSSGYRSLLRIARRTD